jgi:hypothetical protein
LESSADDPTEVASHPKTKTFKKAVGFGTLPLRFAQTRRSVGTQANKACQ